MEIALLVTVLVGPLCLNVSATILIYRDTFSERPQKIVQVLCVWLIPILGAIIVLGVHRREEKSPGTYPAEKDPGDDFALSGRPHRSIKEALDDD